MFTIWRLWSGEPALGEVFEAATPETHTLGCFVRCSNAETSEPPAAASAVSIVFIIHSSYLIENRTKSTNGWFKPYAETGL